MSFFIMIGCMSYTYLWHIGCMLYKVHVLSKLSHIACMSYTYDVCPSVMVNKQSYDSELDLLRI